MPGKEKHDGGGRGNRDPDEERTLPAARVGEKAERRAAVVREHQVEERRDLAHFAEAQARADRGLARLVRDREEQRERKPRGDAFQILRTHANPRASPEPQRSCTHPPQTPGSFRPPPPPPPHSPHPRPSCPGSPT